MQQRIVGLRMTESDRVWVNTFWLVTLLTPKIMATDPFDSLPAIHHRAFTYCQFYLRRIVALADLVHSDIEQCYLWESENADWSEMDKHVLSLPVEHTWSSVGNFGYGDKNDRGERLLEFALEHDMMICNTKFQQKDCRKWTWRSNDGKTKNMIDMIPIRRK